MKDADIIFRTKNTLKLAAKGGLASSLFGDPPGDLAKVVRAAVLQRVSRSQLPVIEQAVIEWRKENPWLEHIPDHSEYGQTDQ